MTYVHVYTHIILYTEFLNTRDVSSNRLNRFKI